MQVNKLLKLSRQHKSTAGFTLVELLISSFIGVLIIGAAGFGMMNLLRNNRSSTAQIQKRTEFNRATEFISDEMRRADTIDVDPTTAFAAVPSPPANAQPVLALNIPGVTNPAVAGVDSPIIYFVSSPSNGDSSVWNGPRVIYRFGPPSDAQGNFTNGAWGIEPLVDGISADSVTPDCDNDWTATPNPAGFYACILPTADDPTTTLVDESQTGETAKIFAIGKLDDGNYNSENYQASTQVFTRAEAEQLDGVNPDETFNAACNFVSGALVCPSGSRTYDIDRLSDSFACKPDGTKWKVNVTAYYLDPNDGSEKYFDLIDDNRNTTGSTSQNVNLASTNLAFTTNQQPLFRVTPDTGNSSGCDSANDAEVFQPDQQNQNFVDSTDPLKFKLLEDADLIPDQLKKDAYEVTGTNDPDKVQKKALEILNDNNLIDSIQNNKVNTGDDYLIAFEIGQTDPNAPGFDFQDQIFKINVK